MAAAMHLLIRVFLVEFPVAALVLQVCLKSWLACLASPLASLTQSLGAPAAVLAAGTVTLLAAHSVGFVLTCCQVLDVLPRGLRIRPEMRLLVAEVAEMLPLIGLNGCITAAMAVAQVCLVHPDTALLNIASDIPPASTLLLQCFAWGAINETLFYHGHRLMHSNRFLYAAVHKLHHSWHQPVALVGMYAHPVEHVFVTFCNMVGPVLFGAHPAVMFAWMAMSHCMAFAAHSGYWLQDHGFHDMHHEDLKVNFGTSGVADVIHGTLYTKVA